MRLLGDPPGSAEVSSSPIYLLQTASSRFIWPRLPQAPADKGWRLLGDSRGQEPGGHGAEAVEQVAVQQAQEVVEEGGDGEDQGELLVLLPAVWGGQKSREAARVPAERRRGCVLRPPGSPVPFRLLLLPAGPEHS